VGKGLLNVDDAALIGAWSRNTQNSKKAQVLIFL
jgi:hypothetical protein